jgi:hypothetical protein
VGIATGTSLAILTATGGKLNTTFVLTIAGHSFPGYTAVYTVVLNLVLAALLTPLFNALGARPAAADATAAADYHA